MPFRDDRDALLARADALARENDRLREEGAAATAEATRARFASAYNRAQYGRPYPF